MEFRDVMLADAETRRQEDRQRSNAQALDLLFNEIGKLVIAVEKVGDMSASLSDIQRRVRGMEAAVNCALRQLPEIRAEIVSTKAELRQVRRRGRGRAPGR
jgi:hypothetical protein